jgi:hypothetical protein
LGRRQLRAILRQRAAPSGQAYAHRQGAQSGIAPQPSQELDARLLRIAKVHHGADHAAKGVAAVEDEQVLTPTSVGISSAQFDEQLALGAEGDGRPLLGCGQLCLAEVQQASGGQEEAGSLTLGSMAPKTTQLCARAVVTRLGLRAEHSWKVQVPQMSGLLNCDFLDFLP